MKLNYRYNLRMALSLNLRALKILIHYVVLSCVAWSLTKLLPYVTGTGSGLKFYVLHSRITSRQLYLLARLKGITTSMTSVVLDSKPGLMEITKAGGLLAMTTRISRNK